jgi:DNA-binding MarR family transcriptional regulator
VLSSLCVEYLDIERLAGVTLDVKRFDVKLCRCLKKSSLKTTSTTSWRGSTTRVRASISRWRASSTGSAASTNASEAYNLSPEDWGVLTSLSLRKPGKLSSPGALARDLELSSGAVTSRLDRLESEGFIRRLPDPGDRRGVLVELTTEGRAAWESAIEVQGRKESFFASALTKDEQVELNALLRKLLLAFDARER